MAHAYKVPSIGISVIFGTGTNAAYVERIENIAKWKGDTAPSRRMVINTEWGFFDRRLPKTSYDLKVHEHTNGNSQMYEKMISGYYLGEMGREFVMDLISQKELFGGRVDDTVRNTPFSVDTRIFSELAK
jgi:hexokinase